MTAAAVTQTADPDSEGEREMQGEQGGSTRGDILGAKALRLGSEFCAKLREPSVTSATVTSLLSLSLLSPLSLSLSLSLSAKLREPSVTSAMDRLGLKASYSRRRRGTATQNRSLGEGARERNAPG